MHCKYCGKEIDEDSIYCKYCGKQISDSSLKEAIDCDFGDVLEDVFGTIYSKDGKQLLKFTNEELREYKIREGTEIIVEGAFNHHFPHMVVDSIIPNEDHIDNDLVCDGELKTIILPNSLKEIKGNPFNRYVKIVNTSPHFKIENELLIQDKKVIVPICALKSCVVPSYIKSIGVEAFRENFLLNNIVLPEGLESIGDEAFVECSSLTDVRLPESLESIGEYAFENCEKFIKYSYSLRLPKKLKYIGEGAFYGVEVRSLTLYEEVKSGSEAFDYSLIPRIYVLCSESLCMNLKGIAEDLWFILVEPNQMFYDTDVKAIIDGAYVDEDKLYHDNAINEEQYKWLKGYRQVLEENSYEEVDLEMQVALELVYQYDEKMEDLDTPEQTYMELISQACW